MPMAYQTRVDGHCRLDDPADSPTNQPLRAIIGQVMAEQGVVPVLIANPYQDGELIACLPNDVVTTLLAAAGRAAESEQHAARDQVNQRHAAERAKAEAQREYESEWRWQLLETTWTAVTTLDETGRKPATISSALTRHLALRRASAMNQDQCKRLCKLLELGKIAPKQGVLDWVKADTTNPAQALILLVMFGDVEYRSYLADQAEANVGLHLVASEYGIDPKAVQDQVKSRTRAAVKAAKAAEAAKADLPLSPAAQASGVRGKAKASDGPAARGPRTGDSGRGRGKTDAPAKPRAREVDVRSGIAAAMQEMEQA